MKAGQFLKNIDLFKDLPAEQLERLSEMAALSIFAKGKHVFHEGDQAGGFYIVQSGRVKIFKLSGDGKEQILRVMESGEPFGEVPMFAGGHYPADAEAVENSVLLFFSREAFMDMILRQSSLAMNMISSLSKRLLHLTTLVEHLSLKDVSERLAAYLVHLSDGEDKAPVSNLNISKGQLANILGTSPETLSRTLGKMSSQGLIKVQGRRIHLLKPDIMKEIASGLK
ncbi:MAG: Crp/Fnr family transcriptional regulator [Syntrophaceae bacterium]|nr:Crp/Fnr family transcriptional regulator [Syntrophaceae bacterium]